MILDPVCTLSAPEPASSALTAICPGRGAAGLPEVTPRSSSWPSGPPVTASPYAWSRSGSVTAALTGVTPAAARTPGRACTCRRVATVRPAPESTLPAVTVLAAWLAVACWIEVSTK